MEILTKLFGSGFQPQFVFQGIGPNVERGGFAAPVDELSWQRILLGGLHAKGLKETEHPQVVGVDPFATGFILHPAALVDSLTSATDPVSGLEDADFSARTF
jgi:hypothetical protein